MSQLIQTASEHYKALNADIANAKDRYEHIRLTALAQGAHNLLLDLIAYETGIDRDVDTDANQPPLEIPEFKSPYNPDA